MRTLTKKYLGGLAVEENCFKVDLAVLDRYQSFSSELLRLALLGIAGHGFLVANVAFKPGAEAAKALHGPFVLNFPLLVAGALMLCIASAAALGHRYFSTDCLTHFVRRMRLTQSLQASPSAAEAVGLAETIEAEEASLDGDLRTTKWLLITSCFSLGIGVACFVGALASMLWT